MDRVPDCRSGGCGFESRPPRCSAARGRNGGKALERNTLIDRHLETPVNQAGVFCALRWVLSRVCPVCVRYWMADGLDIDDSALPHSVQTADSPIGYAHFGHNPRLTRTNRRSTKGPGISSQRTAA